METTPERASALVLFGITGDLAKKMLFPALYQLAKRGRLDIPVIGVAASDWTDEQLRAHVRRSVAAAVKRVDGAALDSLTSRLHIVNGDLTDGSTFTKLKEAVGDYSYLSHYLAIPPFLFTTVAQSLAAAGLNQNARLVVEKPFGHDLASAKELENELTKYFDEDHLLRVDHFLGSEPVEGLKVSRFANTIFTTTLNRTCVDNIQISLAEDFDVADRGSFYDAVGCVRDVFQNHLLQVLTFLTMEPPNTLNPQIEKFEKWRVLRATRTIEPEATVRGQYSGYLEVPGVKPNSKTETYFAAKMWIDNWRWQGVPIYIRSGKGLPLTATEIVVELRKPPIVLYPGADGDTPGNLIRFRLEPISGVTFEMVVKKPERGKKATSVPVDVNFAEVLGREELPYENILDGAITGDSEYFTSFPVIEECWRIVERVIDVGDAPYRYERGTWGPDAAEHLPGPDGWHPIGSIAD